MCLPRGMAACHDAAYVLVGLGRPQLAIERTASSVTLRWPLESAGWGLEASDNLQAGSWGPVTGFPGIEGTQLALTLPVDRIRRFFRLR